MASDDEFITIATLHDPVRAEMLAHLLAEEGITATIQGAGHSSLYGAMGMFVTIPIQVRRADAERARELLETLETRGEIVDDAPEARELDRPSRDEARAPHRDVGPYRTPPEPEANGGARAGMQVAAFAALILTALIFGAVIMPAIYAAFASAP